MIPVPVPATASDNFLPHDLSIAGNEEETDQPEAWLTTMSYPELWRDWQMPPP